MKRRELLIKAGAVAAIGSIAGCVGSLETEDSPGGGGEDTSTPTEESGGSDGEGTGNDGDASSSSDAADTEGSSSASVQSRNITTTGTGCGSTSEAAVTFDGGSSTVSVDGSIMASDPCHVATVERAAVADGTLTVVVGVEADDSGACQQCLGQVGYEARFAFADTLPSTVEVQHASQGETTTVTTESRNVQPH
jgi:hypothetical protein